MSPVFPARRRAEEFDRLVEGLDVPTGAADLQQLAALAADLRALPPVEPRPEFSSALRSRLMAAAAAELTAPDPAVESRLTVTRLTGTGRRRERRLAAGIAALAVVGATTGTALASQGSLPGDALYPVKRAIENIHAGFSTGDQDKGSTLLADASARLTEVGELSQRHQPADAPEIEQTLTTFASQARNASDLLIEAYQAHPDPAAIADLRTFTAQGVAQLTTLQAEIPDTARPALTAAAQTLLSIDRAAANLCPACGGALLKLPASLLGDLTPGVAQAPGGGTATGGSGTHTGSDSHQGGTSGNQPSSPAQGGGTTGTTGGTGPGSTPTPGSLIPPLLPSGILPSPGGTSGDTSGGTKSQAPQQSGKSGTKKSGSTPSKSGSPSLGEDLGNDLGGVVGGLNDAVGGLLGSSGG